MGAKGSRVGRFLIIVACAALLLVMPSGASAGASSSPAPAATVLRLGTTQDLDSLNPFAGYTSVAYEVYHLNYDMLTGSAPDGDVRPEIADSWAMSEDGLTWTFRIHPGIRWQDGVPLTARDVAFTFNYIIDNELSAFTGSTTHIKKAVAVDDTTVEFRLERPKSNMLRLPIPILPEHIWAKVPGDKAATFAAEPPLIGSGPFQVVEVKKGSYVRLVANTDYWKGAPKIDEAIIEIYQNQDTMAMDLRSGAIDVAEDLPAAQFSALQNAPGITAKAADIRYFVEVAMNVYQDEDSLGEPSVAGRRLPPGDQLGRGQARDRRNLSGRVRGGRDSRSSCRGPTARGRPRPRRPSASISPRPGPCSTRPATGTPTATASARTSRARPSSCACGRAANHPSSNAPAS